MKFVIHPQHGVKQVSVVVWDSINNKELCTFVDGEFETDEQVIIDKLFELGYEGVDCPTGGIVNTDDLMILGDDGEGEVIVPLDEKFVTEKSIRDHAKELGIKSWHVKSIETLKEEIAEKEGV